MSGFFSVICPKPGEERAAAQDSMVGAYAEHQWLWRFFRAAPGTPRDFLFRHGTAQGLPRFHVVSQRPPVAWASHWQVQTRPYQPQLAVGERLAFELRANPVVAVKGANGKSARHDVVMQAKRQLLQDRGLVRWDDWQTHDKPGLHALVQDSCAVWLSARAERLGFRVEAQTLQAEGYTQHRGRRGDIQFSSVDLQGELTVTDPAALVHALHHGVGHAKAFGCGLLLVRRLA